MMGTQDYKRFSNIASKLELEEDYQIDAKRQSIALTEKGIDPIDFSQKVEDITRKEAEQKMLMQLPIEERMQLLIAKEQMQEQFQVLLPSIVCNS